jgi:DNA-binding NarL/FixJ family response regulator
MADDCRAYRMKFLLIDDHALIREALQNVLKELMCDATILEASNCRQAQILIEQNADLEVILLDLNLPDGDGFNVLAQVREHSPNVSIVVLSANADRDNVLRALDLGAVGFIPKSGKRAVMLAALKLVLSGGVYIPPEILTREQSSRQQFRPKHHGTDPLRLSPSDFGITERQIEVLALMVQGKSNKEICRILKLAEPTVKNHVAATLKALKVKNRTEAAVAVTEHGWKLKPIEK